MKKYFYILAVLFAQISLTAIGQKITPPSIVWQQTIGGSDSDVLTAVSIRQDKSVTLCGYSKSNVSGAKSDTSFGGFDYWIVKLDSSGNVLWNKTYGGKKNDFAAAIINTADGGYLVGGSSISDSTGSKSKNSWGFSYDYWVIKLDSTGNKMWDKTFGGLYGERLTSLTQMGNGNYVLGGYSYSDSSGTKKLNNLGTESNGDYYTVVLDTSGNQLMENEFAGGNHDVMTCIAPAGANSFYAGGYSYSTPRTGFKSKTVFGNNDYYVLRYNTVTKQTEFQADFGAKLSDYMTCMQVLPDSTLILGGYSNSVNGNSKSGKFFGVTDYWVLKLKKNGTKQWDKVYAGAAGDGFGGDYMTSIRQTKDKGFIVGGYSNSNVGTNKTTNSKGGNDYWIVKIDSLGKVQWDKTIGGTGDDKLVGVYELDSARYIAVGTSNSPVSGDKTSDVVGSNNTTDYWVVMLGNPVNNRKLVAPVQKEVPVAKNSSYSLYVMPNPVKDVVTIKYNAAANARASFIIYNAGGKAVLQSTLTATTGTSTHSFNIAQLSNGAYYAVMYIGNIRLTKAFTKE